MANTDLQYDRNTVNLVLNLKRSLPLEQQADFKLTDPELIPRVKELYRAGLPKKSKALAEQLLIKAGVAVKKGRPKLLSVLKTYESTHVKSSESLDSSNRKIYRGQPVK